MQPSDEELLGAVAALQQLDTEMGAVLEDTNSMGGSPLRAAIREHLTSFAQHLAGRQALGQRYDEAPAEGVQDGAAQSAPPKWPSFIAELVPALSQLFEAVVDPIQESVSYNIGRLGVSDLPRFLVLLGSFPAAVPVEVRRGAAVGVSDECREVPRIYRDGHVFDMVADPLAWRSSDASGLLTPRPPVQKLLYEIAKAVPLSYNAIAVLPRAQVGSQKLTHAYEGFGQAVGQQSASAAAAALAGSSAQPTCGGVGLSYSPAHCLFDAGWGSLFFSLSTEPPFDGVLAVAEMSKKDASRRPKPFVQPVASHAESLDQLMDLVDSVYKSLNTPSPDILFLSPMVGNCLTLRRLGLSRRAAAAAAAGKGGGASPQLTPKLVWVPINPLLPPPVELAPNFTEWHARLVGEEAQDEHGGFSQASWWYAQCSLSTAVAVLKEQGYALLHVEHLFAVFVLGGLWPVLEPMLWVPPALRQATTSQGRRGGSASLYDHWLRGWACSPAAPTLLELEWGAGVDLPLLSSRHASAEAKRQVLCDFVARHRLPLSRSQESLCDSGAEGAVADEAGRATPVAQSWRSWELQDLPDERGKAHVLASSGKGRCLPQLGFCECFPPHRGRFCEESQAGPKDQDRWFRGVLHYLVGDREKLLADLFKSLRLLWRNFNSRFDYPVVVFHDGLAEESRRRILEASPNRIWFAFVEDYLQVPRFLRNDVEMDLGGYSLGYRAMCRFRAGTMFTQPVMRNFDLAWTLDTDGYFPAEITVDPFEQMWRQGHVYSYSHISRDQASAVQHFWEFCRLYFEQHDIDPKGTRIMRRITDALVLRDTSWHEWNRLLFMNDIEITQLKWFRSEQYQDFFGFLDSVGGFWLYRWGDHAVRTIAVALFLEQSHLMKMGVPYGHQETCRCGVEHPDDVCVRSSPKEWWQCMSRDQAAVVAPTAAPGGAEVAASGDVGTIDDDLVFGGE